MIVNRLTSGSLCVLWCAAIVVACGADPDVAKREYVKSGDSYAARNALADASLQYRNAIALDPNFGEARFKLAETYAKLGDVASASREYVRAADLLPGDGQAQLRAGQVLLLFRKFEDAKARAERALALAPNNVDAQILKGNALAGLRNYDQAIAEIEDAIRADPDRSFTYAKLGVFQYARGDRRAAERAFQRAIEVDPGSVTARLSLANFYGSVDELPEAESVLNDALRIAPGDPLANRMLAMVLIASDRPAEAETPLQRAAASDPTGAGTLPLADYYVMTGRTQEARACLERIGASDQPMYVRAQLRLASLAASGGDYASAYRITDEVIRKDPANAQAFAILADIQLRHHKVDAALASAEAAVRFDPGTASFQFILGRVRAAGEDYDGAIAAHAEALKLNPALAQAELELGRIHLSQGKPDQAIAFARNAIQKAPGDGNAYLLLASAHITKGEIASAESVLSTLGRKFSDDPAVQVEIGRLSLLKGDRAGARAAFERALQRETTRAAALESLTTMDLAEHKEAAARARMEAIGGAAKDDPFVLTIGGRLYLALGDYGRAETLLKRALDLQPSNLPAYVTLARVYAVSNRTDEAVAQLDRGAREHPRDISARTLAAMLVEARHKREEARERYEKILAIDARAAVAANNLAWLHVMNGGNLDVALGLAQTARSEMPESAEVADTLAWIYHRKGLNALAIPLLREAAANAPGNATIRYHLGAVHAAAGDPSRARVELERAIAMKLPPEDTTEALRLLQTLER